MLISSYIFHFILLLFFCCNFLCGLKFIIYWLHPCTIHSTFIYLPPTLMPRPLHFPSTLSSSHLCPPPSPPIYACPLLLPSMPAPFSSHLCPPPSPPIYARPLLLPFMPAPSSSRLCPPPSSSHLCPPPPPSVYACPLLSPTHLFFPHACHCRYDIPSAIPDGSIQRAGENTLALLREVVNSPFLTRSPTEDQHERVVYFDFLGQIGVVYSERLAMVMNFGMSVLVLFLIFSEINWRKSGGLYSGKCQLQYFWLKYFLLIPPFLMLHI